MWFQVELPQPAMVTEVQFDSPAAPRRRRRWRGAPGARRGAGRGPARRAGAAAGGTAARRRAGGRRAGSRPAAGGGGRGAGTRASRAATA